MKQILLAYGLPTETVTAIMMFYRNMKVKVHSLNGDMDFFDIYTGVSTLPVYSLPRLCTSNVDIYN